MVEFRKEHDSFAVVYEDGRNYCNNIPKSFENLMDNCVEGTKAEFVSMVVEGEYLVR